MPKAKANGHAPDDVGPDWLAGAEFSRGISGAVDEPTADRPVSPDPDERSLRDLAIQVYGELDAAGGRPWANALPEERAALVAERIIHTAGAEESLARAGFTGPGALGRYLEASAAISIGPRATAEPAPDAWPAPLDDAAYHGLAGDIVGAVRDHTEADPVAVLATFVVVFGALVGRGAMLYQGSQQAANLNIALVGESATGRKGTAFSIVREIFDLVDPGWEELLVPGLGSGEGLIGHLKREENREHRAIIYAPEFGGLLGVMGRDGSTLSPTLRDAWDGVPLGRFLAREESLVKWHHVAVLAHVTVAELRDRLTAVDAANGFGNRFLWLAVRRSAIIAFPTSPRPLVQPHVQSLFRALEAGREPGELRMTPAGASRWEAFYESLTAVPRYGLLGAITARAEAQVARLALVYALLDRTREIDESHLAAAEALWDYASRSARHVFGDSTGNPVADFIRAFLRDGPATREELRQESGVRDATRLAGAIDLLVSLGIASVAKGPPKSRAGRRPDIVQLVEFPAFHTYLPARKRARKSAGPPVGNEGNGGDRDP